MSLFENEYKLDVSLVCKLISITVSVHWYGSIWKLYVIYKIKFDSKLQNKSDDLEGFFYYHKVSLLEF